MNPASFRSSRHGASGGSTYHLALLALIAACSLSALSAAAAVPSSAALDETQAQEFVRNLDATLGSETGDGPNLRHVKRVHVMDCNERCEVGDILVFKAYWQRNFSNKHFVDFLRDLVVYSAYYRELRPFKPLVDKAVQRYELCRYVTCSTDYLG